MANLNFVVGVGASAGGIEALEAFFSPLQAGTGMAFVVVTHLGPGHESQIAEILRRHTALTVVGIEDGVAVADDHIYVLPRESSLTIEHGRLRLTPPISDIRERNPIDVFFSSLADDQGERSVGVVLSGGGSDGTLGIKAIKKAGGLTLAQGTDGSAPRHQSMPFSAISSGLVDLALPVEEMAEKLLALCRKDAEVLTGDGLSAPEDEEQVEAQKNAIYQILRSEIGHDFAGYKDKTFLRRVRRRMQVLLLTRIENYVDRLRADADEVRLLFRDLLISVTDFFRDEAAFAVLEATVIPRLFEGKGADDTVRVWVPGCATGEEVYSIAILLREHMAGLRGVPRVQLFGTDVDEAALTVARTGRYPLSSLKGLSAGRLAAHFTGDGPTRAIAKTVRDLCVFSAHSLIRDPPFSRINLISCRNLLIYFGAALQDQVVPIFHYALQPGGFLFLGLSENVSQHGDLFLSMDKKNRVFKRRDHVSSRPPMPLGLPGLMRASTSDLRHVPKGGEINHRQNAEARVLERHTPAYVVVDGDDDIVYFSPRTGKYLEAPAGPPNRQLMAVARRGLRLELREALRETHETRRPATRENIAVEIDDRQQRVSITAEPLTEDDGETMFLVLFADVGTPVPAGSIPMPPTEQLDATNSRLERELSEMRERLQSKVEEYETAIEELRSANEELVSGNEEAQSTNEELESSKEELQSLNEEMLTVNSELSRKVEALDQANSDLRNLFESTQIATVFLDRHLIIRNFTPAVSALFNLIPSDCGRPLTDIVNSLDGVNLRREFRAVLEAREPVEKRITAEQGTRQYLMRLLPYRTTENIVDGLLVTFIDITTIAEAETHQKLLVAELNHRVRNMLTVVIGIATRTLAPTSELTPMVDSFLGRLHALASAYEPLADGAWVHVPLRDIVVPQLAPHLRAADQAAIDGPEVLLKPKAALVLGMVIHELSTNAAKYGALSEPTGKVAVRWRLESEPDDHRVVLEWREMDGPAVSLPTRRGFGSELIERTVSHELDGKAQVTFDPEGVRVVLTVSLSEVGTVEAGPAAGSE
jgi:two-component system, chemotaxis family, CheB/CheR fusion protein